MDFKEFREIINSWYTDTVLPKIKDDEEKKRIISQAVEHAKTMRLKPVDLRVMKEHGLYYELTQLFIDFVPFGIKIEAQIDDEIESIYFDTSEKIRGLLIEIMLDPQRLKEKLSNNVPHIPDGEYIATAVSTHTCEEIGYSIPFEVIDGCFVIG